MKTVARPVHGGLDPAEVREMGLDPHRVIDFSASVNPLGAPLEVRRAIAAVDPAVYPDRECAALKGALSARLGVGEDSILAGNGSTELLHLLARAWLRPGKRAFIFGPTFGEYQAAAEAAGAAAEGRVATERDGFRWRTEDAIAAIRRSRPSLIFLCNPNNPTGVYLDEHTVLAIASAVGAQGLLVVDEAYRPFANEPWDSVPLLRLGNVVLIRSMTKDYGLAGLRLGYLLAMPDVVQRVARLQPSWSVNALAQAAGVAALGCEEHVRRAREVVREGTAFLQRELRNLGLEPLPSAANFLLVKVGAGARVRRKLLERGLCVRDCASFGLPEHIRIAVRTMEDCRKLAAGLREVLSLG